MQKKTNKLYFAYGSNMNQERLEGRVGPVIKIGKHVLRRWKLAFNCGYANNRFANIIMGAEGAVEYVEGVLYELTPRQMRMLDNFEGYPLYYQKMVFPLNESAIGNSKEVMYAYVCFNPNYVPNPKVKPTEEYINHILKGVADNELTTTLWQLRRMRYKGEIQF